VTLLELAVLWRAGVKGDRVDPFCAEPRPNLPDFESSHAHSYETLIAPTTLSVDPLFNARAVPAPKNTYSSKTFGRENQIRLHFQ